MVLVGVDPKIIGAFSANRKHTTAAKLANTSIVFEDDFLYGISCTSLLTLLS